MPPPSAPGSAPICKGSHSRRASACAAITTPGHQHLFFDAVVDSIAPRDSMSFHWQAYAGDPAPEPPEGPPTLVRFTLADSPGGILLTVMESGFDRLPAAHRGPAFASHAEGWDIQLANVARHVLD